MAKMAQIKRVETFYDPGRPDRRKEDQDINNLRFVGVVDTYSAPHSSEEPQQLFNGLTGGQMVCNAILQVFSSANPSLSLERVVLQANEAIANQQRNLFHSGDLGNLAGASFALAKIEERAIEILQGGDCYALWVRGSGKLGRHIGITKNYFYPYEYQLRKRIAELMEKHQGDRDKAWVDFCPELRQKRAENTNVKYAVLNGRLGLEKLWQKIEIPLSNLVLLMLFSDGLVPFSQSEDEQELAPSMIRRFMEGGFESIIEWTREVENVEDERSHEAHSEATGQVIWFS